VGISGILREMEDTTKQNLDEQALYPAAVCVLTGRGMAAIASVAVAGPGAEAIVGRIFSRAVPACGRSAYGILRDGEDVIDSVVVGCEGAGRYVIHCHGNPLLAERVMRLCERLGAVSQRAEEYLLAQLKEDTESLIEAEARLEMTRAATLDGVKLLNGQISGGLAAWAKRWLDCKSFDLKELQNECREILERSLLAGRILGGVRVALVGPPNSGKSTLLNWLAGDTAALVSDAAGTTRDWVSTTCRIGPLRVEIIDTAGLDCRLAQAGAIEQAAQQAALDTAGDCDLILNVRDCTRPPSDPPALPPGAAVLNVFSKSDLLADPQRFCPACDRPYVLVSAAADLGRQPLCESILTALNVDSICPEQPVCFTSRQREHLDTIVSSRAETFIKEKLQFLLGRRQ